MAAAAPLSTAPAAATRAVAEPVKPAVGAEVKPVPPAAGIFGMRRGRGGFGPQAKA